MMVSDKAGTERISSVQVVRVCTSTGGVTLVEITKNRGHVDSYVRMWSIDP